MQRTLSKKAERLRHDLWLPALAILFVALLAMASIPILTHPLPPLADYVNHLARTHVIGAIGSDSDLARYYTIEWELLPNLMIDLVVPILNRFVNIYIAGQIFTVLAFALIASGTLALNRALVGRWSVLPLIAMPLLYNGVLLVGVMNYVFGIGLALWGLAAWIAWRERAWPIRLAISVLFVLALYICHLFAVGLFGLGLLAVELHRLWSQRTQPLSPRLVDFAATGLPFVPVAALLVTGSTWTAPGVPAYWEMWGKIDGLMTAINVYYPPIAYGLVAAAAIALGFARYRGVLRFHPIGWAILGIGTIVYLAMPRALFSAHLADQRLPIAIFFMAAACLDIDLRNRSARRGIVALIVLLMAARTVEVQLVWNHLAYGTGEVLQSVKLIDRGARVLVVHGDRSAGTEISDFGLAHAASLATIESSAMVTTAFTVRGKHILHVRDAYARFVETEDRLPPAIHYFVQTAERPNADVSYFWDQWPQHYDYVYVMFTTWSTPNPAPRYLDLIYGGPAFQLYHVMPRRTDPTIDHAAVISPMSPTPPRYPPPAPRARRD